MSKKIYPDSGVELNEFTAKNYDAIMNIISFGVYKRFIHRAIKDIGVKLGDNILDMGCGTGRNAELMIDFTGKPGKLTGIDISQDMEMQFLKKFENRKNVRFINQRIDQPFTLDEKFDKVFISFVIHGFPHEVRSTVIKNAYNNLKPGGAFFILDFAEFDMDKMPWHHRLIFKKIECKYAFDYIKRDWKKILSEEGFSDFEENFYMKNYVRLLKAVKAEK